MTEEEEKKFIDDARIEIRKTAHQLFSKYNLDDEKKKELYTVIGMYMFFEGINMCFLRMHKTLEENQKDMLDVYGKLMESYKPIFEMMINYYYLEILNGNFVEKNE